MKKYFLLTLTLFFFSILVSANTIKKENYVTSMQINIEYNSEFYEVDDKIQIDKYESKMKFLFPTDFIVQIGLCAQVQMDVANSFYGNPNFTPEQVNEMALGAFMGCMGWLR
jgi:hypothetical protein